MWLSIDTKIRIMSHGRQSLDDFAQHFFSIDNGDVVTHTYNFNDVVSALNAVQPYDWSGFLHNWLEGVGQQVPLLSGIEASGWQLVYTDTPSLYQNALENIGAGEISRAGVNAMFSVDLFLTRDGEIEDVLWGGPAFKAGLAPGMNIISINGHKYSTYFLRTEIAQAQQSGRALRVVAQGDSVTKLYVVDYEGGLKYPQLVRTPGKTDYLKQILAPRPVASGS